MKVIRVKEENKDKVLAAIPGTTLTDAPDYDWNIGLSDDVVIPATGMVGVKLPENMSGKQANKIIKRLV